MDPSLSGHVEAAYGCAAPVRQEEGLQPPLARCQRPTCCSTGRCVVSLRAVQHARYACASVSKCTLTVRSSLQRKVPQSAYLQQTQQVAPPWVALRPRASCSCRSPRPRFCSTRCACSSRRTYSTRHTRHMPGMAGIKPELCSCAIDCCICIIACILAGFVICCISCGCRNISPTCRFAAIICCAIGLLASICSIIGLLIICGIISGNGVPIPPGAPMPPSPASPPSPLSPPIPGNDPAPAPGVPATALLGDPAPAVPVPAFAPPAPGGEGGTHGFVNGLDGSALSVVTPASPAPPVAASIRGACTAATR